LLFALLFHFGLNLNIRYNPLIFPVLPFFVAVKIGSFFIFRIYKMTWRYVGLYDLLSIMRNVRSEERGVSPFSAVMKKKLCNISQAE
jgi:FlaA1/EpsC-like NDP-sugar epimerase